MSEEFKKTQEELEIERVQEQEAMQMANSISREEVEAKAAEFKEEPSDEQQQELVKEESVEQEEKPEQSKEEKVEEEQPKPEGRQQEEAPETNRPEEQSIEGVPEVPEQQEMPEDYDALKKEVEDLRAVQKEEASLKEFEAKRQTGIAQYNETCAKLADALMAEFKKYGIDTTKALDDIQKEDPAKAQIAIGLISQAERLKDECKAKINSELNSAFSDVVFNRAARLMNKFPLTDEQQVAAAETFINIFENTGIKDMGDDLMAKVELAVARAKMVAPAVEKAVKETKEAVDAIKEVVEVATQPIEQKEETAKPEEPKKPEPKVEAVDEGAFEEGITGGSGVPNANVVTVDNVLEKLAELPHRERVAFYKEHFDLINQASTKQSAEIFNNRRNS